MQSEPLEHVQIFSWSDDLDLCLLVVLMNSTISNSRDPGNIYFYLLIPDDWEEKQSRLIFKGVISKIKYFHPHK